MKAKYPKQEIKCQYELFNQLVGMYDVQFQNDIIASFREETREIIDSFEDQMDRVPSGDEIIWVMSERRHKDIREIVKQLKENDDQAMGKNPAKTQWRWGGEGTRKG